MLTVGLAGCSDGDDKKEGQPKDGRDKASESQTVRAAYRRTAEADTARMTLTTQAAAAGESVTARGDGVMDLEEGDSRMTLTAQGQKIEQRALDGVVYQKAPAEQRSQLRLPPDKTWMKIDLARLDSSGSGGADGQVSDPAESFGYARGVTDRDVTRVGTDTIDGARTTHYRVKADVEALAEGDPARAKALREQLGTSSLPLDMWLDDQGRLRQQTVRLSLRPDSGDAPKQSRTVTSTTTLKFSDFGTEADVEAPAAEDTVDVTGKVAQATKSPGAA
ncbi:hypothetical protein [Streptomyces sp. V4I2]|uniref:DUF7537 family lipoprotein n=1 Tax=Streptomyces sp. V4I2 TaxID=3042280 RepID=UPI0027D8D7AE|nr:hypothetical protein [Streptomyces sp. V4I2]